MSVAIVNYGMGNVRSVLNAVRAVGGTPVLATDPEQLAGADRIILPGVGAFGEAMRRLHDLGFVAALEDAVLRKERPFLGICLGMQLLGTRGFEHGETAGLGWVPGDVRELAPAGLRVPHMGWNTVTRRRASPLLAGLPPEGTFYFVHSFQLVAERAEDVVADADYGGPVTSIVSRGHIHGTQFHPEKSHKLGLALLRTFVTAC